MHCPVLLIIHLVFSLFSVLIKFKLLCFSLYVPNFTNNFNIIFVSFSASVHWLLAVYRSSVRCRSGGRFRIRS